MKILVCISIVPDTTSKITKEESNKFLNRKLPLFGAMFPLTGIMIFSTNNIISKNIGIGILIIFLVGLIGTLTIGKNKWLKLKKE